MSAKDYRELLRTGKWFHALTDALQEKLLRAAVVRDLTAGQRLFSRGDPPSGIYGVVDGAIRISSLAPTGKEVLLTMSETPAWFGEICVFDGRPRTHDAIADGEARVVHVPQPALDTMLHDDPTVYRDLGLLMTNKLRLMFISMEDLTVLSITTRLARRLVLMAEGYGELHDRTLRVARVKQEQLATMLSSSRQTANQSLKELESKGLVRVSYGEIEIVDLEGLRQEAGLKI